MDLNRTGAAAVRLGRVLDRRAAELTEGPDGTLHGSPLGDYLARRGNWLFLLAALIMWSVAWPTLNEQFDVPAVALPIISGLSVLPLAVAWYRPGHAWTIVAATAAVFPMLPFAAEGDWQWRWQVCLIISLLVVSTLVYLRSPMLIGAVVWASTAVLFYVYAAPGTGGGWVAGVTAVFLLCVLVRLAVQSRSKLAEQTEVSELERARRAAVEERTRIARDLHDVVAHRMSLVVVQAQTAQYRVPGLPDAALTEFDGIAAAAREALGEVRSLLGVLRVEDGVASYAPAPGLAGIDELVDGARAAGVSVEYLPPAEPTTVPEGTGLVAYRIVQESVANATRHAQGSTVTVALTTERSDGRAVLNLRVDNGPRVSDVDVGGPGLGQGIPGMVERARAVGGSLTATPTSGGGFAVHACLPA